MLTSTLFLSAVVEGACHARSFTTAALPAALSPDQTQFSHSHERTRFEINTPEINTGATT